MSDSKHVPGPWKMRQSRDGKRIWISGETKRYGNREFLSVDHDDCDHDEAEATARLIAAAPDLLAACEAAEAVLSDLAAELCERHEYTGYFNSEDGHGLKVIKALQAAIARAGGR